MSINETTKPSRTGRTVALVVTLIVAGVVVLALVAWLAVGLVRGLTPSDASGTVEIEDRFDSVVLESDVSDVTVEYDDDVARGELTLEQNDGRYRLDLDHEVRGDTLHVSLRHEREFGMPDLWWPSFGSDGPELILVLPESLAGDPVALDLRTDVGDVRAEGDFAEVGIRTAVGDIELEGSADALDLHTDAGEIDLAGVRTGGELVASSAVGDVTLALESLPSGIRVETEAGEVHAELPRGRYALTAETSLGDVDLDAANDPTADRRYDFATSIGDISVTG